MTTRPHTGHPYVAVPDNPFVKIVKMQVLYKHV